MNKTNELVNIQFSGEEMDKILELQKELGTETVQETIMNTIELAIKCLEE